jgi:hypothetical protein
MCSWPCPYLLPSYCSKTEGQTDVIADNTLASIAHVPFGRSELA